MNSTTRRPTRVRFWLIAAAVLGLVTASCSSGEPADTAASAPQPSAAAGTVVVHRTPTCGCCKEYEEYLRRHGWDVESVIFDDLSAVRAERQVPNDGSSCHTSDVGGYVVEGHVPVEAIDMLLESRPAVDGITVPGMPTNAPGMGPENGRLEVLSFTDGGIEPFVTL
jgi:hypothetical protein